MPRRPGSPTALLLAALICAGAGLVARRAAADPCSATHQFDAVPIPTDSGATMVRSADLDGDGLFDLVVIRGGQGKFEALRHASGPTYTSLGSHSWTSPILRAILGDFDGDGHLDLAFTDDASHVVIFRGGGDGSFAFGTSVDLGAPVFDLVSADLDGDGHAEIVVSQPTSSRVTTLRWTSAPFGYVLKTNSYSNTLPDPYFLAIGKIQFDTRWDLIASRRASARAFQLRGTVSGDGTFTLGSSLSLAAIMTSLTLSDVDQDNFIDLIYGAFNRVVWHYGLGAGTFSGAGVVVLPGTVTDVVVDDLNRDGVQDLLCAVPTANLIAQVSGSGARAFTRGPDCAAGISPQSLAYSPIDRRRLSDFAVATRVSNGLAVLRNTCDLSVITPPLPPPDLGPPIPAVPPPDPPPGVEIAPPPPPAALPDPGPLPAASAWPLEGVVVCNALGNQTEFQAVDDFAHGAYFAWVDERNGEKDIYAVRLDAGGHVVPGWTPNGTPVCRASGAQSGVRCFTDGKWGVWLTWLDLRSGIPSLYLQKLTPDGQPAPGWPADGRRFCADSVAGYLAFTDRRGGVQIVWNNFIGGSKWTYMQHLGPDGQPFAGWQACGNSIMHDFYTQVTCYREIVNFQTATTAWPDGIRVSFFHEVDCHQFAYDPPYGDCYWCNYFTYGAFFGLALPVAPAPVAMSAQSEASPESERLPGTNSFCSYLAVSDEGNGGYYTYDDCNQFSRYGAFGTPSWSLSAGAFKDPLPLGDNTFQLVGYDNTSGQYRIAKVLNDGNWSPGFGSSGVVVAQAPSSGIDHIYRVTDGSGGMLIAWTDARVPGSWPATGQLYATWLRSDGTRGPNWRVDGNPIGNVSVPAELDFAVADRRGSAIVGWRDSREGEANLYASRVTVESPPSSEPAALGPFKHVMTDATHRAPVRADATRELSFAGPRPNPVAGDAAVEFTLSRSGDVSIRVLDVAGRTVRTRELRGLAAGNHRVALDDGTALAPGIYVVELDAERKRLTRKLVVAR